MPISIKDCQEKLPILKETINKIAKEILSNYGISRYKICIVFLDNEKIRQLNERFANRDCPTDVLAFPYHTITKAKDYIWADIAISTDMAIENSSYFKTRIEEELCLYVIHGILHLLGFDDKTKVQRRRIEKEQRSWLVRLKTEISSCLNDKRGNRGYLKPIPPTRWDGLGGLNDKRGRCGYLKD